MTTLEWYFDFISGFAYQQLATFDRLPDDIEIVYRPVLFAGLLKHFGHKGPAEIPAKRRHTYRQWVWQAAHDGSRGPAERSAMTTLEWYFDSPAIISGFAYQQLATFDRLPDDIEIVYRPVLFAGLLKHFGHKGPAEIPAKRRHTYRQWVWQAAHDGIPFRMPPAHPFNPLRALRLALALDRCDARAIATIFDFIWRGRKQAASRRRRVGSASSSV